MLNGSKFGWSTPTRQPSKMINATLPRTTRGSGSRSSRPLEKHGSSTHESSDCARLSAQRHSEPRSAFVACTSHRVRMCRSLRSCCEERKSSSDTSTTWPTCRTSSRSRRARWRGCCSARRPVDSSTCAATASTWRPTCTMRSSTWPCKSSVR